MDIVAVDIGGTNARFAIASVEAGRVLKLGPPLTLQTNAHVGPEAAWAVFAASTEQPLPRQAALAGAAPGAGGEIGGTSLRARRCRSVWISVVPVQFQRKELHSYNNTH